MSGIPLFCVPLGEFILPDLCFLPFPVLIIRFPFLVFSWLANFLYSLESAAGPEFIYFGFLQVHSQLSFFGHLYE